MPLGAVSPVELIRLEDFPPMARYFILGGIFLLFFSFSDAYETGEEGREELGITPSPQSVNLFMPPPSLVPLGIKAVCSEPHPKLF